jgi:hypothetical protein
MGSSGRSRYRALGYIFLGLGVAAFIMGTMFRAPAIATSGFAACLVGLLLEYLPFIPTVSPELIGGALMPMMMNLEALFKKLHVSVHATYIGPGAGRALASSYRIFVPLSSDAELQWSGITDEILIGSDDYRELGGLLLDPPGSNLLAILERESTQDMGSLKLSDLQEALEVGIVRSLELASSLRLSFEGSKVHVLVEGDALWNFTRELAEKAPSVCERVGCPLCSLVACALAKCSHSPVRFLGATHLGGKHKCSCELTG